MLVNVTIIDFKKNHLATSSSHNKIKLLHRKEKLRDFDSESEIRNPI